jgi:iron(III) transport system substrate-binding protein
MKRLAVLIAFFSLFSTTAAWAAAAPKWWIGSQDEYQRLVNAAKKEGKLVWWSHPDPACKPLVVGPFEKEYGVQVEHTEYTTAQIVQRVMLEDAARVYTVDVSNLSVHHVPRLEQRQLIKKLPFKERVAMYRDVPALVSPSSTAIVGYTAPRGLAYNSQQVSKEDLPRSYQDLLNPKWQGKIGIDTDVKEWIILAQEWGVEKTTQFLDKLGDIDPKFHTNNTVVTQMTAAGEVVLAPGIIRRIAVTEFKGDGAPVDWAPLKPMVPVDLLLQGAMAHAPHPNAAELFMYWIHGSPEWLRGLDKCGGYGNSMIPGNPQQEALKDVKTVYFDWQWGAKAAKDGTAEKFRRAVGAE